MFAASAVFPLDRAVFGGAKVFFGSDGGWVVRVSWQYLMCWKEFEVYCIGFGEVRVVICGWIAVVLDE